MDPTHLLGLLSIAINTHQRLKSEIETMEKRCDHLKRVHLLWNSFFSDGRNGHRSREVSETIHNDQDGEVINTEVINTEVTASANESSIDKNTTNNKLNRISKRIKRILSSKPEDQKSIRTNLTQNKGRGLKVANGNLLRSKSEDESTKMTSLPPSIFLVSEISKQMFGHHGMKLGDVQEMMTTLKGKGRKSTSLSIDTQSKFFDCSRRASYDVVTSSTFSGGQNISHSRSPTMDRLPSKKRHSSNFPETLKCALLQTNALLPVFPTSSPSSSRHQSSLSTLHEEMVSQWLSCDSEDFCSRPDLKISNDDVFQQTDDDEVTRRAWKDSFSDSRSLPGDVKTRNEFSLSVMSCRLKSGKDVIDDAEEGGNNRDKSSNFLSSEPKNNISQRRHSYETPANLNFQSKDMNATGDINSLKLSTQNYVSNFEETNDQLSIKVPNKFIKKVNSCEEVNKFSCQIKNLKEQLKIMNHKISFLNDLLNSRICWMEDLHTRYNFSSSHAIVELKFLRQIFKTHVDELLKELYQEFEPMNDEQTKMKELEELFHGYHGDDAMSTKFLVFCISRLLEMFHRKFQQMKLCMNRKDLILQSLENELLLQQVTNKLLKSRKRRKMTNETIEEGENITQISKELQQEIEHNCIDGTEKFETEIQKILSKVDNKGCQFQRQLAQEKYPVDEDEVIDYEASTNSTDLIITDGYQEENSSTKIEECIRNVNNSPTTGTAEPTSISKDEKLDTTSLKHERKASEGDDVYEFSLNDLLVGQENISANSKRFLEARHQHDNARGKKHNLSIFRPSVKKSDWVIREAKLPYFEIKSYNNNNNSSNNNKINPNMSSSWMEESKQEKVKDNIPDKLQHSSCPVETYENPKDLLPTASLNISPTQNRSDPIKELYDNIPCQVNRSRSERNSFDMWTCVDGYNKSPPPERCDRSSKRSSESSKSSKTFLNKISPNKSPLNICKNLCLVNGQSGSFDDGTKE